MTRTELYHDKPKRFYWKGPIFFLLSCIILFAGFYQLNEYWQGKIRIDTPKVDLGKKVVVHLPNGQEVFTFENLIVKKDGKTFYKGDRVTIDLTGGTIEQKNW